MNTSDTTSERPALAEKRKQKHNDRFYSCPGAWVGNLPHSSEPLSNAGNITVDASAAYRAFEYLRRFYRITGSDISRHSGDGKPGISISIECKGNERVEYAN